MWPSAAFAKEIFRRKLFAECEEFNDGEVVSESKKEALRWAFISAQSQTLRQSHEGGTGKRTQRPARALRPRVF